MPQNPRTRNSPENQGTQKKRRTLPRHPPDTYLAILGIGFTLQSTFSIFIYIFHIQSLRLRLTSTFSPCHVVWLPHIVLVMWHQLFPTNDLLKIRLLFAKKCAYLHVYACTTPTQIYYKSAVDIKEFKRKWIHHNKKFTNINKSRKK